MTIIPLKRVQSKRAEPARESAPTVTHNYDKPYPGSLQENLLTMLCHRQEGREVAQRVDPTLFEGDYQVIAERAVEYWKKYDRPPEAHINDLLSDILESKHDRRAPTFRGIIVEMLRLNDAMNVGFVLDKLGSFIRMQKMQGALLESARKFHSQGAAAIPEIEAMWGDLLQSPSGGGGGLIVKPASAFAPTKTQWMRRPFLLRRTINLLTGPGGVGKTLMAVDAAARRSRRGKSTIYFTIEDEPGEMRMLMEAMRGDPDKLLFIKPEGADDDDDDLIDSLTDKELEKLERIIISRGDVRMLVIDPFVDFSARADQYNEVEVRRALKPLRAIAKRYDIVVMIVVHFNKKEDLSAINRTSGSAAFRNVPRSVLMFLPDRDDPSRTIMIQTKYNKLARGADNAIGFTTRIRLRVPIIVWEKELHRADPDEVVQGKPGRPSKQDTAVDILREMLAKDLPVSQDKLEAALDREGISWATARRVKDDVPMEAFQKDRKWYWKRRAARED